MADAEALADFCARVDITLEPFQKRIAAAALGPQRELLCLLPRGNGKSYLLAVLAVHHLLTTPRAAVYVAAASREQASVIYGYARRIAEHPAVADRLTIRHLELREDDTGGRLHVLASDAPKLHGLTPSLAIVDELHAHRDAEVYIALRTAIPKRPGAKMWTVSTAGQGVDSPLGLLRARALAQPSVTRRGAVTDARGPSLRMLEWAVDEDADVDDPRVVKRANPASWLTTADLAEQRAAVPDGAFRRYHASQWVAREGSWLPPTAWSACVGEPRFEPGEPIWIGVDVGGERSATGVVWVNDELHVGVEIFHGTGGVLEALDQIRFLAGIYRVAEVRFDPWSFAQGAQELERERICVVPFPQNDSRMIPASGELHDAIIERRLVLPDHPELRAHAANAVARHSRRGWRLESPNRATNIDGVVALCMALSSHAHQPPPVEPPRILGAF